MCGIAGIIYKERKTQQDEIRQVLRWMISTIKHRGPDSEGFWTDGVAAFTHARLAIIDLSDAGIQPMQSQDGSCIITFNGEIYNYLEIKKELEGLGRHFRSQTDTEVLLQAYQEWGTEVLNRLNGMFAFAIWDIPKRRLFLARDRLGQKPVYYYEGKDFFVFASEIKALFRVPGIKIEPNLEAIHHYLTFQYTPSPLTAFQGIKRLPPAHTLIMCQGEKPVVERYWSLPSPREAREESLEHIKDELIERLRKSVQLRMIADVPFGAFLSGGVDSSAVVAMMADLSSTPIKTFSIGFKEKEYDETRYARLVAKRYHTEHHEFIVRPDAMKILPKLVWYYNEPYADPSAIPTYYVSEMARRYVKVVLNGDGGDESFLGYGRYAQCRLWPKMEEASTPLKRRLNTLAQSLPERFLYSRYSLAVFKRIRLPVNIPYSRRYSSSIAYFLDDDKNKAYGEALKDYLKFSSLDILDPYFEQSGSPVTGAAWADIHTYLPDDLLVKVDIASMAHSLEARSPFLDHTLMEWAAKIPETQKMLGNQTKGLLKKAVEPYLPKEVIYRPKMGFGVPIERWLREDIRELVFELLCSKRFYERGLIKKSYVKRVVREHMEKVRDHRTRLWALIMLELWYRTWIDGKARCPLILR